MTQSRSNGRGSVPRPLAAPPAGVLECRRQWAAAVVVLGMRVSVGPERLLGACLIAKPRPAWTGVPLIALPPSPPLDEQIVSLSQLALHAQGSPLVLAPRGGRKPPADEPSTPPSTPDSAVAHADEAQAPLPRVLKPRKRRKRERAASAPAGPGLPSGAPSALCACALCRSAYPTPPVSPLRDDFRRECCFHTSAPSARTLAPPPSGAGTWSAPHVPGAMLACASLPGPASWCPAVPKACVRCRIVAIHVDLMALNRSFAGPLIART